jgi:hypothetical protein
MESAMKLLFENWRKYVTEADTDNDGIDDEKELAIIDKGEIEPEEEPESIASKLWTMFLIGGNPSFYVKHARDAGEDEIAADLESFFNQVNNIVTLHEHPPQFAYQLLETMEEKIDALYNLSNFGGKYEKKWNVLKSEASKEFKEALVRLISSYERLKRDLEAPWHSGSRGGERRIREGQYFVKKNIEWFYEFVGKTPSWTKEK